MRVALNQRLDLGQLHGPALLLVNLTDDAPQHSQLLLLALHLTL